MKSKTQRRKEALARIEYRITNPVPASQDLRVKKYPRSVEARKAEMDSIRKKIGAYA